MSAQTSYTKVAIRLHWVIAFLIIALLAGGKLMGFIPNDNATLKFMVYNWHKTIGLLILVLSIFRIYWRLTHKPPALSSEITGFPKLASKAVHMFFYVFMIAMPLIGWAIISTSRFPSKLFNAVHLPKLPILSGIEGDERKAIHGLFEEAHEILAYIAMALIVLHVAAAIKHHMSGNDILARMLPSLAKNKKDK